MDEGMNHWREALRRGVQFSETTKCRTVEIFHRAGVAEADWIESPVDDVTLPQWLDTAPTLSCSDRNGSEAPVSGLRLVIATGSWNNDDLSIRLSCRDDTFARLQNYLGLPDYFLRLVTSYHTRGFEFSVCKKDSNLHHDSFLLKIPYHRKDFFQIAINYDQETNTSSGLAVVRSGCDITHLIRSGIEALGNPSTHPLLLPVILLEREVNELTNRLSIHHQKLDDLEATAGQHEYSGIPVGDPLELDFVSVTRRLNFIGCGVTFDLVRIKCFLLALEQVTQWGHCLELRRSTDHSSNKQPGNNDRSSMLTARVDYLTHTCRILLLEAESEKTRVQALSQAVYQFMAAKDAKTNLSLAETSAIIAKASKEDSEVMKTIAMASKRDSSAMKTISILGMFFLPGTFIAAIFAMPVFNWDGNGAPAIKPGFKYYWAVAIPLTILVLGIWALSMLLPWKEWFAKKARSWTARRRRDIELRLE